MRADRLLSLMMLLQTKGRMPAQGLAEALEVSVRTIYRDIEALGAAGVPVYTQRGPGGGCALLESYRTSLTGLTEDEVRALFTLAIPAPLAQLGLDRQLRGALLKLSAALPAARRHAAAWAQGRIHLDSLWWFQSEEPVPHLQMIQQALFQDRRLLLRYRLPFGAQIERRVEPYGLVAKSGVWYLVCWSEDHLRVFRVSRILQASVTGETFTRPPDFDLAAFWAAWCAGVESGRPEVQVRVRVAPGLVPELPRLFGDRIREQIEQSEPADPRGWLTLSLSFETFEAARERMLSFGGAVEVLEPEALRRSVRDFAEQIAAVYDR